MSEECEVPLQSQEGLGISICPGRHKNLWKRSLEADLLRLEKHYHADVLVSLITSEEMTEVTGVPQMNLRIQEHGIESLHFSIDRWIPVSVDSLVLYAELIVLRYLSFTFSPVGFVSFLLRPYLFLHLL